VNTGASFPIPSVTVPGQFYRTLSDKPVGTSLLQSFTGLWKFDGTTVTKVTDPNYPPNAVAGITELDGTYYVMDVTGQVRGSALQDPMTWPALNFIAAEVMLGVGAGIVRHLNYIAAYYTQGVQLFYDAGNPPPGSPLGFVGNASWRTGCAAGDSIVEQSDVTFFLAQNQSRGRTIQMMEGLSLTGISTPAIERILNRSSLGTVRALSLKSGGHTYYILTVTDISVSLVYDPQMKEWYVWTSVVNGVEQYFSPVAYLNGVTQDLLQDSGSFSVVAADPSVYTDVTGPINVLVRTPAMDWKTLKKKRFAATFLLADTSNTTVNVRYSDDDYQTFSPNRPINMASVRKMLQRCGSSRRRSWDLSHSDNQPLKLYAMTFDMSVGPS
jgi:hypothetical protein